MTKPKLLVIDDDEMFDRLLSDSLQFKGFEVQYATSGEQGIRHALEYRPDLVILDVMMPEMDGWQTCARLREISDVPVIMLTAKTGELDVVHGFEIGVDDYITKPYHLKELEMRIRAVLKRCQWQAAASAEASVAYDDGDLTLDLKRRQVLRNGTPVHLTPTEFRLLCCLVCHSGTVIPHAQLLAEVWGAGYTDATANLSLYIRYLREKLEEDPKNPRYIRTQWGEGYWFEPAPEKSP